MGTESEWGGTTKGGWKAVPVQFLRRYVQLSITTEEAMFIIMIHSYVQGTQKMHPKVQTMARMLGKSAGTVRRYIRTLRSRGYLTTKHKGTHQTYHFDGLYDALHNLVSGTDYTDMESLAEEACSKDAQSSSQDSSDLDSLENEDCSNLDSREGEDCSNMDTIYREESREIDPSLSGKGSGPSPLASVIASAVKQVGGRKEKVLPSGKTNFRVRRRREPRIKPPSEFTARDVFNLLGEGMQAKFGHPTGRATAKELGQLKAMIEEYTPADVVLATEQMIDRWDDLKPHVKVNGFPSVSLLYGYRRSIVPWSREDSRNTKPAWGAHFKKEDERPPGEESGFSEEFLTGKT